MPNTLAGTLPQNPSRGEQARRPKVVSLSCLYPTAQEPGMGLFVQRRLQHLAEFVNLRIVAPMAILQYGKPAGQRLRLGPQWGEAVRYEQQTPIYQPRWFYPPMAGAAAPFWLFARLVAQLRSLRREFPFDVIDTHFGHPEGIAGGLLSAALGVPFTMTLRGNEPKHSRSALGRAGMAWALGRASRVFTVSERLRQFAIEMGAAPAKVKTIPNGVDASLFYPRDQADCRARHGLPLDRRIVLSAGALVERKGHHRVVRALHAIRAQHPDVLLVIAGAPGPEGRFEDKLRDTIAELSMTDSVRLAGQVDAGTLAELMSAADLFCLSSTNEGWPNVVHEALACGAPVVATDVGAIPDMLAGGANGIMVPVHDQAALEHALSDALSRSWDRAAISAWGRARTWRQVACEAAAELQAITGALERPSK